MSVVASTVAITSVSPPHKVAVAMVVAVDVAFALRGNVVTARTGIPANLHTARMAKHQVETAVTGSTDQGPAGFALRSNAVSATEATHAALATAKAAVVPVPVPTGAVEAEGARVGSVLRFNEENVIGETGAALATPKGPRQATGEAVAAVDHGVYASRGNVENVVMAIPASLHTLRIPVRAVAVSKIKVCRREEPTPSKFRTD